MHAALLPSCGYNGKQQATGLTAKPKQIGAGLSFSCLGRQGFREVLAWAELEPGLVVGLCFIPIAGIQSIVTIFARGIGGREEGLVLPPKSPAVVLGAGKKRQTELRNQSSSAPSHAAVN